MSQGVAEAFPAPVNGGEPVALRGGVPLSALGALLRLTIRQHARGRRLWVVAAAFALPAILAGTIRYFNPSASRANLESALVFGLLAQALIPLACLWYASSLIQDEIEEQTLTYLLVRPLPRWSIYLAKALATWLVLTLVAAVLTLLTDLVLYADAPSVWQGEAPWRALKTVCLFGLNILSYCALFGLLSLFVRRSLVLGVIYIFLFEDLVTHIDFVARRLTVLYYFQTLTVRWLDWWPQAWDFNLATAPSATVSWTTLLGGSLVALVLGSALFSSREYRVKTPEGT